LQKRPVVSGEKLLKVLVRLGYEIIRQRGSHVRLRKPTTAEETTISQFHCTMGWPRVHLTIFYLRYPSGMGFQKTPDRIDQAIINEMTEEPYLHCRPPAWRFLRGHRQPASVGPSPASRRCLGLSLVGPHVGRAGRSCVAVRQAGPPACARSGGGRPVGPEGQVELASGWATFPGAGFWETVAICSYY
jgi:predicted RNA binding protein YcfA (HicA-like mRNA interferase family)